MPQRDRSATAGACSATATLLLEARVGIEPRTLIFGTMTFRVGEN
jgi:hypothetical protein